MSNTKSREMCNYLSNHQSGWFGVLTETQLQLKKARDRVQSLEIAGRIFEERVKVGAPFPAAESGNGSNV